MDTVGKPIVWIEKVLALKCEVYGSSRGLVATNITREGMAAEREVHFKRQYEQRRQKSKVSVGFTIFCELRKDPLHLADY